MLKVMPISGVPGDTIRTASTDTAQAIPAAVLTDAGRTCQGLIITVDTNPVRIAFSSTPTQGTTGLGHTIQKDGVPIVIMGAELVSSLKFISATNATAGGFQYTPLYST